MLEDLVKVLMVLVGQAVVPTALVEAAGLEVVLA
ncbi:MAG: hypothetical protein RLZZ602_1597 [Pseudomonadota bacterium]